MKSSIPVCSLLFPLLILMSPLSKAEGDDAEGEAAEPQTSYVQIRPPFVTNIVSSTGRLHFVKADITLRVRGAATAAAVSQHDPLIKNQLVTVLSSQEYEFVSSREGRANLRDEVLLGITEALEEEEAASDILDVLFTDFLVE